MFLPLYKLGFSIQYQVPDYIYYPPIFQGASIIRMLNSYLGKDVFMSGLSSYLKTYQLANARTEDLWTSLSQVIFCIINWSCI